MSVREPSQGRSWSQSWEPDERAARVHRARGGADGWRAVVAAEEASAHLRDALAVLKAMTPGGPDDDIEAARQTAIAALHEAMRTQDAFLHATAHDLRNPLAAIRGQVQLLQRRARRFELPTTDADRLGEALIAIDAAVGRTTALIDHLLDSTWRRGDLPDEGSPPAKR